MIELELFYKTVEAEIRRKHIVYLKKQKCLPEGSVALSPDGNAEDEEWFDKLKNGDKLKFVKRFNKGIDTALKVLSKEFTKMNARLQAESEKGVRM